MNNLDKMKLPIAIAALIGQADSYGIHNQLATTGWCPRQYTPIATGSFPLQPGRAYQPAYPNSCGYGSSPSRNYFNYNFGTGVAHSPAFGDDSNGEADYSDDDCKFCQRRSFDQSDDDDFGDGDDDIDIGGGGGDDGLGEADCCAINKLEIEDIEDRTRRFLREMQDDIDLIFSRIGDRMEDMLDRITRLENRHDNILSESIAIEAEIDDINRDADTLLEELGNTNELQNEVAIDFEESVRNNGLFISSRWVILGNNGNGHLFIQDRFGGGFYRFRTTGDQVDVDTNPVL